MVGKIHSDTLAGFSLTTAGFPDFHTRIQALRFPISVAEVLELRDLINHSADNYEEPADIPQNREFRDSLESAIHSFGIENRHHCERLLKVLAMLRGMHYQHMVFSRNTEQRLRQQQADNRTARRLNLRNGILAMLATAGLVFSWLVFPDIRLPLKLLPLGTAVLAFSYMRTLPRLDRNMEQLTRDLNDVLRKRIDSLNWRTLIHKLSLLLGYKQIQGIEVFRHEVSESQPGLYRLH